MHLIVRRDWEVQTPMDKIFGNNEIRRFPLIEINLNVMLFCLDIDFKCEEDHYLSNRYICTSMKEVEQLIKLDSVLDHRLSLLSRRGDNEDNNYSIDDIVHIEVVENNHHLRGEIIQCVNGKRYFNMIDKESGPFKTVGTRYDRGADKA